MTTPQPNHQIRPCWHFDSKPRIGSPIHCQYCHGSGLAEVPTREEIASRPADRSALLVLEFHDFARATLEALAAGAIVDRNEIMGALVHARMVVNFLGDRMGDAR